MLDTNEFIRRLINHDYTHICTVPCSFAKSFINAAINNSSQINYFPCASEAVACSVAAGLKMSGYKPLVVVQSSGLTNMGSCITSLLIPYQVSFPIIVSWRTYNDGDSEIQHSHLALKLPDLISAYGYEYDLLDDESVDIALKQIEHSNHAQSICVLRKGVFSEVELEKKYELNLNKYPKRSEYLDVLNRLFKNTNTIFIGTTGNTSREMKQHMTDTKNFYMVGNMGGALSIGLGAFLSEHNVIVCGGDAEFVMHMGGLTTAGRLQNGNNSLLYIVFDNESNKSTGGQNTYQTHLDYGMIASGCNFKVIGNDIVSIDGFEYALINAGKEKKVSFLHVKCDYDDEMPRPSIEEIQRSKNVMN